MCKDFPQWLCCTECAYYMFERVKMWTFSLSVVCFYLFIFSSIYYFMIRVHTNGLNETGKKSGRGKISRTVYVTSTEQLRYYDNKR